MKAADLGIIEFPRPIPTWPGPRELLPYYSAGWDAYRRYHGVVQGAWLDASARGVTEEEFRGLGYTLAADPAGFAPPALGGEGATPYHVWCIGWAEHQAVEAVVDMAYRSGTTAPDTLWQLATAAVQHHRDSYLSPPPSAGNRRDRRAARKQGRRR